LVPALFSGEQTGTPGQRPGRPPRTRCGGAPAGCGDRRLGRPAVAFVHLPDINWPS